MKKIFYLFVLFILISTNPAIADDMGLNDYVPMIENAWYGQKPVTDQEFEKTMQTLETKKNKKKNKQFKGKSLKETDESSHFGEALNSNSLLILPVEVLTEEGSVVPVGHYQVSCKRAKDNKLYFEFLQSQLVIAKFPASETTNDFNEKEVNFVKILPYNEKFLKLIYGSVEYNAYAYININGDISDY